MPGDDRRDRERQVDQGDQQVLAPEIELGDAPRRRDAEDQVDRHGDARDEQGEPGRAQGVRLPDGSQIGVDSLGQSLVEHQDQRQDQGEREERQGNGGERPAHGRRLAGRPGDGPRRRSRRTGDRDGRHGQASTRRRAAHCSRLMARSSTKETSSITSATAVAPA